MSALEYVVNDILFPKTTFTSLADITAKTYENTSDNVKSE